MTSSRFQELEHRVTELEKRLIPPSFDPTGTYDDIVYEQTRAFRMLVHAEFESFIEDRTLEVVNDSFKRWKSTGEVSTCLLAVVAHKETVHAIPESLSDSTQKKYPDLSGRVESAKNDLNRYIRTQNNGIKEKHLLRMMLPVGFVEDEIDQEWLSTTETWATSRGDTAHKSAKMQVQPDPRYEVKIVKEILKGFRDIDFQMTTK